MTAEILAGLATDYDLTDASVHSIAVRSSKAGLRVDVTLAAPRRFVRQ